MPVTAPMVGKFYAAPSPSDPPYVEKGTKVAAGATVGLIEVMKVFASIKTETAGVIERILVSSGEFVEFGQTLFLLRPDARNRGALPWTRSVSSTPPSATATRACGPSGCRPA